MWWPPPTWFESTSASPTIGFAPHFSQLPRPSHATGGIVHEARGDALVAEFSRASDGVCAALAAQANNAARNDAIADEIVPELRVGIALGEVIIANQTITGAGVVLAQRLEELADTGGVCISGAIREAVPDRLAIAYASLGEQAVKGFDEPVRAYSVS